MNFRTIDGIRAAGFDGFLAISALQKSHCSGVPDERGIYVVLWHRATRPDFLEESTGGHFKGKNPTVAVGELESRWVEDTIVLYMGKTGGAGSRRTLRNRLTELMRFGQGEAVGHYGGRLIWQLRDASELLVCWKVTPAEDPRIAETSLMQEFEAVYGRLPFANLIH